MTRYLLPLLFVLSAALTLQASPADRAYQNKNYVEAARLYQLSIDSLSRTEADGGKRLAGIYYNLGNCHYRLKDYPAAVLAYRRALRLRPSDEDARFNLELTEAKLTDTFDAPSEMFFISWMKALIYTQSFTAWGLWGLCALILALTGLTVYLSAGRVALRKAGFALMAAALLSLITFEAFAALSHNRLTDLRQAVVTADEARLYSSPVSTAQVTATIHAGTTVIVRETAEKGRWLAIELPDGRTAWAPADGFTMV